MSKKAGLQRSPISITRLQPSLILLLAVLFLLLQASTCKRTPAESHVYNSTEERTPAESHLYTVITFGSCNKHNEDQKLWKPIIQNKPDIWIWLGDIIYADTKNMEKMEEKYNKQKAHKEYQALLQTGCEVIGIWDDHDYGANNAGKEYSKKKESRDLLFDFLDIPKDSPERQHKGAYNARTFGKGKRQVKTIMLDARYFRDQPIVKGNGYEPHLTGNILGEKQWEWLEAQLKNSSAAVHVIGTGIQVIPEQHRFEKWANFPNERKRLFDLIAKTKAKGVILISGDRHIGEISQLEWEGIDYPLFEVTSSGLTHYYKTASQEKNDHRQGNLVSDYNFGMIEINWASQVPKIQLQIRGKDNEIFEEQSLLLR